MAFTNTASALRVFGGLFASRLHEGLKENNSNASGELDASITFKGKSTSKGLEMSWFMLEYYEQVDEGRKPGTFPNVTALKTWLTLPNVQQKLSESGFDQERKTFGIQEINSAAYLIGRKIEKEGTKGNHFLTNVENSRLVTQDLPKLIQESVGEDIDELMGSLLDGIN